MNTRLAGKYANYLTVRALEDNFELTFDTYGRSAEYCIHSEREWKAVTNGSKISGIKKGDAVSFRAEIKPTSFNDGCGYFNITKACSLEGNCMSLLFGDNAEGQTSLQSFTTGVFGHLFSSCKGIRTVSKSFLPATTISPYCYAGMFSNCSNMTSAPDLPSDTLDAGCYSDMFNSCTSLVEAPVLCAKKLVNSCYNYLFYKCSSLNYIKALFTTTPSFSYTRYWLTGTASSGVFVKSKDATWTLVGDNGIPNNWTIITE